MTTQAKTPAKRTTKPAAKAAPVATPEASVSAPAESVVEAPVAAAAPAPAPAPVVAPAPVPAPTPAPAAAPAPVASVETTSFFAAFEMPKIEMPKFEFPAFEMPKFDAPSFDVQAFAKAEIPAALRDFAEKAVGQAKAHYEKLKVVAEEATDALEDTYETARAGLIEFNSKSIDATKANSDATLGHAKNLLGVKTFAEAIELQTAFVRQQYEAVSAQAKELQEMATRIASEAGKPAKDVFDKTIDALKKD